jgi:hypothetical protein
MSSARLRLQAAHAPLGAYAPGGPSTGNCRMTTTTHSHKAWTDKGGHVKRDWDSRKAPRTRGTIASTIGVPAEPEGASGSGRRCQPRRPSIGASVSQGVEDLNLARGKSQAQITCGTSYPHLQGNTFTRDGVEAAGVVLG